MIADKCSLLEEELRNLKMAAEHLVFSLDRCRELVKMPDKFTTVRPELVEGQTQPTARSFMVRQAHHEWNIVSSHYYETQ